MEGKRERRLAVMHQQVNPTSVAGRTSFPYVSRIRILPSSMHEVGAVGQPSGMGCGGRWEGSSGSGGAMYTCGQFMLI